MSKIRIKTVLLALILLFLSGTVLWIAIKVQDSFCDGIFRFTLKQEGRFFTEDEISTLEDNNVSFSYFCETNSTVSNGVNSVDIPVIVTNENCRYFTNMEMEAGGFFNAKQADRKQRVAVVNTDAAYQLFGNRDCVGEYIYLKQTSFQIIGVAKGGNEQGAKIYIQTFLSDDSNHSDMKIKQIWCEVEKLADAVLAITKMGYKAEDVDITGVDLYKKVFWQRFYLIWIVGLLLLFIKVQKSISKHKKLKFNLLILKRGDLLNRVKKNRKRIFVWLISFLVLLCLVTLLRVSWCVPPGYELLDANGNIMFQSIVDFYLLVGIELNHVPEIAMWNILSLIFMLVSVLTIYSLKIK